MFRRRHLRGLPVTDRPNLSADAADWQPPTPKWVPASEPAVAAWWLARMRDQLAPLPQDAKQRRQRHHPHLDEQDDGLGGVHSQGSTR